MEKNGKMNIFGIVMLILLIIVNLLHLLWTIWLTTEQIETGWGSGTNMDLAVLYPWATELLCSPILIAETVFFILSVWKRPASSILLANSILFGAAVLQYAATNLFIWF